jgi:general secretion pathway protein G
VVESQPSKLLVAGSIPVSRSNFSRCEGGEKLSRRSRDAAKAAGRPSDDGGSGYTFVELLVVVTILLVLASAVLPLAQVTSQRQREAELRRDLREMRTAIDKFKDAVDTGQIPTTELKPANEGYPPDLETLVEGVSAANDATGRKLKYLRRIPIDPMTNSDEWGLRSYQDKPDSTSWGGQNVFDVYTKNGGTALDGTKYRDW